MKWLLFALLVTIPAAAGAQRGAGSGSVRAADRAGDRQTNRWSAHIEEASVRFGIPETWIRRVMRAESGGRTMLRGRPITSRAGAMGLMQLMPGTWNEICAVHGLGPDPHDPRDNVMAGTAYLRAMYDRFGYPGLFGAYNAGPERYGQHLSGGRPLPAETVAYVAAVGKSRPRDLAGSPGQAPGSGIFVLNVSARQAITAASGSPAASGSLFVRLTTAVAATEL